MFYYKLRKLTDKVKNMYYQQILLYQMIHYLNYKKNKIRIIFKKVYLMITIL
jgi:hypothetical protein